MTHKTILLAGLLLAAGSSSAQRFSLGIRAGYTLSDVTVKEPGGLIVEGNPDYQLDQSYRPLHSLHAGIDVRLRLSERFSIVSGLQYARKGHKSELFWPTGPADANYELHYLNLPVVADFKLWKGLALQGGFEAGKLLGARIKSAGENIDIKSLYEDFDFGLVAGFEYRFNDAFFVHLRHIFGIYPIQKIELTNDTAVSLGEVSSRNSATQLSVGYRYVFGK